MSLAISSCALCASSICFSAVPEPWPCFRGNAERCGVGYLHNRGAGARSLPGPAALLAFTAEAAAVPRCFAQGRRPCSRFPVSPGNGLKRVQGGNRSALSQVLAAPSRLAQPSVSSAPRFCACGPTGADSRPCPQNRWVYRTDTAPMGSGEAVSRRSMAQAVLQEG